ncbi:MAG: M1 family aminopeptidase [Chloroflexota bacterium]
MSATLKKIYEIFRFELLSQVRNGANYIFFGLFFVISLGITVILGSELQKMLGTEIPVLANAPFVIILSCLLLTILGLIGLSGGLFGKSATKDFDANFDALLVTSGVSENHFIVGRLFASWLSALLIFLGIPLGLMAGLWMPFNDPIQIAPFHLESYLNGYVFYILPNVLIFGTLFFAVALLTRRALWAYIALPVWTIFMSILFTPLEWLGLKDISNILDVFGVVDLAKAGSWTAIERNSLAIPISGALIINRLLWLGLAVLGIWLLTRRFQFSQPPLLLENLPILRRIMTTRGFPKAAVQPVSPVAVPVVRPRQTVPEITLHGDLFARLQQFLEQTRFEFIRTAGNRLFWIVLIAAAIFSISTSLTGLDLQYGVASYPTTARLMSNNSTFTTLLALLLIFLLGEGVWRERDNSVDGLIDTTSAPSWVFLLGKLAAVILVQGMAMLIFMLACMLVQTTQAYFNYELSLYIQQLFSIDLVFLSLMMVLALFVIVLINNKYVSHFVNLMLFIGVPMLQQLPFPQISKLSFYGYIPLPKYSDMNGFGHYLDGVRWFQLYWILVGVLMVLVALLFWQRGVENDWRARLSLAQRRLRGTMLIGFLGVLFALVMTGGWITYNTQVLSQTPEKVMQQEFEKQQDPAAQKEAVKLYMEKYAALAGKQPVLAGVALNVDMFPHQRQMTARVRYTLENHTSQPLTELLVDDRAAPALQDFNIAGQPITPTQTDLVLNWRIYRFTLPKPLLPSEKTELVFTYQHPSIAGFSDKVGDYDWVENGTTVISDTFFPEIGYLSYLEEALRPAKKEEEESQGADKKDVHIDAEKVDYLSSVENLNKARQRAAMGVGGRKVPFEGVICTDPDQTGLLPGGLVQETQLNGRRCFSYKMDAPMGIQFFIVSGRYARVQEQYNGINLEIYYHPSHAFNLDSLMDGMKTSLDVNSAAYTPYPFRQLRIVEMPAYHSMAVSTPGMIVFGEEMGMYSRIPRQQPGVVDYPFFVAAHETSHEWWGEQLMPARAEGLHVILETQTQYSAVKAVEKFYGVESVRNFLQFEMKQYTAGRLTGRDVPLAKVTGGNDSYIYYNKGAVVMYTLRDYLGAEALDGSLHRFFDEYKSGPPFALSIDLMDALRRAASPNRQSIITDLLETVTLWNLTAQDAVYKQGADGKYEVTLRVQARKMRMDSLGKETVVEMKDDPVDIGLIGKEGKFIYLEKHPIHSGENTIVVTVSEQPIQAGIDPIYKLMDRETTNNMRLTGVKSVQQKTDE